MFLPTIAYDTIIWKKQCIADTYAQSLFLGEFGNQITPADAKIVSDKNTVFTSNEWSQEKKKMWELNSRANLAQFHPNWAGFRILNL